MVKNDIEKLELELELLYLNINQRLMKDELHYINKNLK